MSYRTHQAVQAYFDAVMHFNLLESDVINFIRKGNVVIINTSQKAYLKTINNELSQKRNSRLNSEEELDS